jgi:UDP:flavonoid glycosyltransferase YjiC (YdhE family)
MRRMGAAGVRVVGPVVPPAFLAPARDGDSPAPAFLTPGRNEDSPAPTFPAPERNGNSPAPTFPAPERNGDSPAPPPAAHDPVPVLLSSGAWGVGSRLARTAGVLRRNGYLPMVLCGRDEALRRRLAAVPGVVPLGWVADMPGLLARVAVLVDNAAGQTAVQAMASGVPVVAFRPIAGHGIDGARHMAHAGVAHLARDEPDLLRALRRLTAATPARRAQLRAARGLFRADAAQVVAEAVETAAGTPVQVNRRARAR